jgi:hypothetical protein
MKRVAHGELAYKHISNNNLLKHPARTLELLWIQLIVNIRLITILEESFKSLPVLVDK